MHYKQKLLTNDSIIIFVQLSEFPFKNKKRFFKEILNMGEKTFSSKRQTKLTDFVSN